MSEKKREKIGDEDELEGYLGEIPNVTSFNLQNRPQKANGVMYHMHDDDSSTNFKYTCGSPVSGFSLPSDGSSSSFLSVGHESSTPPFLEEFQSRGSSHCSNGLFPNFQLCNKAVGKFGNENSMSELALSEFVSRMRISDEKENLSADPIGCQPVTGSICGVNGISLEKCSNFDYYGRVFSENLSTDPNVNQPKNYRNFDYCERVFSDNLSVEPNGFQPVNHSICRGNSVSGEKYVNIDYYGRGLSNYEIPQYASNMDIMEAMRRYHNLGNPYSDMDYAMTQPSVGNALFGVQLNRMNVNGERGALNSFSMPQNARWPHSKVENILNGRTRMPSNARRPQGGFGACTSDDSLIIQGEGLNFVRNKKYESPRAHDYKGSLHDRGFESLKGKTSNPTTCSSSIPPPKYESLVDVRGYIFVIAKDQDGCRFLQKIFEEGTPQDKQIVFGEIIGHVVELMVDPFGNYLMQKLLDVCNEEQRMQILLMLTEKPGQLIRISLNTHGTRVVQKLIETLKIREQISLVISAIEPGFLALIKDLNGNHVIKQCLQCLSNEDNKFIFVAAAKYCVDVATHQHGCCVLQCCISLLAGKHRENLVKEISSNGILLAQDEYGNFVIQFILELEIPSAKSSLISQFEGNYVHLSTQKFSSHVVEKCLVVFNDELRSKIIHELLSASQFKQLLQDPYANYVIGKALKLTEGSRLHNVLLEAIRCHESILRNCPYSKKLLSAIKQYRENTISRKIYSPNSF